MPLPCKVSRRPAQRKEHSPDMMVSYPASLKISGRAATRYIVSSQIRFDPLFYATHLVQHSFVSWTVLIEGISIDSLCHLTQAGPGHQFRADFLLQATYK